MQSVFQDLRYGFRQLRKSPGFSIVAVLSLALGIGATTAVFSVIYAVVVNPYPYVESNRMVHLVLTTTRGEDWWTGFTGPQYQKIRESASVESAFAQDQWNLTTTGGDVPEDVNACYLTGNTFNHLGMRPKGKTRNRSPCWVTNSGSGTIAASVTFLARTSSWCTRTTRLSAWRSLGLPGTMPTFTCR